MGKKVIRKISDFNDFIDFMTGMSGRKFITFGYAKGVKLSKMPKKMVPNPEYGIKPRVHREISAPDWDALGAEMGREGAIGGVIKFTTYNCKYSNAEEITNSYDKYKGQYNDIRSRYGIEPIGKSKYETDMINYGTGVKQYGGNNEANKNHLYSDQNLYGATRKSRYFIVDNDGNVDTEHELTYGQFERFMSQKKEFQGTPEHLKSLERLGGSDSGYSKLVKLNADDDTISRYLNDVEGLRMLYNRFLAEQIVFMVGKVDNEYRYFFNKDKVSEMANIGVKVNMNSFLKLATDKYKDSIEELDRLYDTELKEGMENAFGEMLNEMFGKRPVVYDGSESLDDKMIDEAASSVKESIIGSVAGSKRTVINRFYRLVHPLTSRRFSDTDWSNVHMIFDAIGEWSDSINVWVDGGGYGSSKDGMSKYKDWQFEVEKDGFTLRGYLRASACGTVDNVWNAYDVTVSVW